MSEISLGSWLTFEGGVSFDQTKACTEAALEVGINFFDTANAYGKGAAESAWGQILSRFPRDSYLIATKLYAPMSDDLSDMGLSAAQIAKQIDASLTRLQTDYVDLYQAHRFDTTVPIEETVEALQTVVAQGKVRYLGFSEWTPAQISAALELGGDELFVSSQPQYSMLWRAPEAEVFPLCAAHGISHVVWSPLAQGVLSGKYLPGQSIPPHSRFANKAMNMAKGRMLRESLLQAVQRLVPIAKSTGMDMPTMALAWVLCRSEVASAITGASRPEQVIANTHASGVTLTDDVLAQIDTALADTVVTRPTLAVGAREGVKHRCPV